MSKYLHYVMLRFFTPASQNIAASCSLARQTSLSEKLLQLLVSAIVAMELSSISVGQRYNDQAEGTSKRQRRSRSSLEPYEFRRKP